MDIWTGSISVESDSLSASPLQDLRLSTPSSTTTTPSSVLSHLSSSLSSARLSLISLIDPTRIPLFLAAGPSLELTTTSPATASYFRKLFLSQIPASASDVSDGRTVEQSRVALLVRVTNDEIPTNGSWIVTELAIYGAITHLPPPGLTTPSKSIAELTPPNSSPVADIPAPRAIVTVHALPLSSHHAFLSHLPSSKPEPQSPASKLTRALVRPGDANSAVFIAPNPQDVLNPSISHSAKKRGAAALDAAADPRKRAKRPGVPPRPPPLSLLGGTGLNRNARAESADPRVRGAMVKRERSPSPSPSFASSKRPLSSGNRPPMGRRRDSSMALTEISREGSVRPTSSSTVATAVKKEVYGEVETRNRAELAKMVVTGMRACGLRDYRNGRAKTVPSGGAEEDCDRSRERDGEREKEEYKQVYHHTSKAAAFTFRNVISVGTVDAEKMKEVVDRLLGMFCEPKTGQLLLEAAAGTEGC